MPPIRKVSVAIASWNGRRHLATCLAALREQRDPGIPWEVLVLDNGSGDGTCGWIRREHPEVRLLGHPVNIGFAPAMNRLVEEASGDAVAFLNNDTRPTREWLAALVETLAGAPQDVAAVSGMIVDWSGERLDFARGILTFDGHAFQMGYRRPLSAVDVPAAGEELLFACGGNMLVRRQIFQAEGGFDGDYFAYLEDVDLGWRLWAAGHRVVFAPEAVVHHRSMATSDLLGNDHRGFLFERNAFLTAYKNYQDGLWGRVMPAILLTLWHRTQTLLVQNNPGGEQLTFDPYAGLIADTAPHDGAGDEPVGGAPRAGRLLGGWRRGRARELVKRVCRRGLATILPASLQPVPAHVPRLADGRTIAQLRAWTSVLSHLDVAAEKRQQVQRRRRRDDREIFERFPPYLIPTYPGDERLFAGAGFESWWPEDLPLVRRRLEEVMELPAAPMR